MTAVKSKTAVLTPEASAAAQNVATAAALAEAELKANTLSIAADEADLAVDAIDASWTAGDADVSAEAYSVAQIELRRTTALSEAAAREVTRLQRSFISTDKQLAEIVKVWAIAANPGVPVMASFIAPPGTPDTLPTIYVIQQGKTEVKGGGVVAGRVEVRYLRHPLHREFSTTSLEHQASLAGCGIRAGGSTGATSGDGVTTDRIIVTVEYAHEANPVMGEPTEALAGRLAQSLTAELAGATDPGQRLLAIEGGGMSNDFVTVKPVFGAIGKVDVDETTGQRTTEVQAKIQWWRHGARTLSVPVETRLRSMVKDRPGTFSAGLGDCLAASVQSIDSPDNSGFTFALLSLTFTSRTR